MSREQKDYIDYPYDGIKDRRKMSMESRASQFNPFDALTGFGNLIKDSQFVGDELIELSQEQCQEINDTIISLKRNDDVRIIFYDGEKYKNIEDIYLRFDQEKNTINLKNGRIPLKDIIWVEIKDR